MELPCIVLFAWIYSLGINVGRLATLALFSLWELHYLQPTFSSSNGYRRLKYEKFLLFQVLFLLQGLVMDFILEFGHAGLGIAVGGVLTYIQVACFEIYPKLAITSQFLLGRVEVQGLTGFNYGLFLLGGSITTNIVSWLLAIVLRS